MDDERPDVSSLDDITNILGLIVGLQISYCACLLLRACLGGLLQSVCRPREVVAVEHPRVELLLVHRVLHGSRGHCAAERRSLQEVEEGERVGVLDVLDVGRRLPVLQVLEEGDEGFVLEVLLLREVVDVRGARQGAHELELGDVSDS